MAFASSHFFSRKKKRHLNYTHPGMPKDRAQTVNRLLLILQLLPTPCQPHGDLPNSVSKDRAHSSTPSPLPVSWRMLWASPAVLSTCHPLPCGLQCEFPSWPVLATSHWAFWKQSLLLLPSLARVHELQNLAVSDSEPLFITRDLKWPRSTVLP